MDKIEQDFRWLYGIMTGDIQKGHGVDWEESEAVSPYIQAYRESLLLRDQQCDRFCWVENAGAPGTVYSKAYEDFWTARENLCERYGMDWEDVELERFMNGISALTEDVARRMFYIGIRYAALMEKEKK